MVKVKAPSRRKRSKGQQGAGNRSQTLTEPSGPATDTAHLEKTSSEESREHASDVERNPEEREADSELLGGVKVRAEENGAGDETTFEHADEDTSDVETGSVGHERLEHGDGRPAAHEERQPDLESDTGKDDLRGEFRD